MKLKIGLPASGLISGTIFGLGLSVSQMVNPEKVLSFLDVFGNWDPSLLLTMAAAIAVTFVAYRWVRHKGPVLEDKLHLPENTQVDRRLLIGATIFGIGWGLAGYCPGPAVTGIATGSAEPFIFLAAMFIGSQVERLWMLRHPAEAEMS